MIGGLSLFVAAVLVVLAYWARRLWHTAAVGSAYKAKILASSAFVSGLDVDPDHAPEANADAYSVLRLFEARIDRAAASVTASFHGLRPTTAVYRPGLGTTLARRPIAGPAALSSLPPLDGALPWPDGEAPAPAAEGRLAAVLEDAFAEPDPRHARRTRAVVVVKDGKLVAERYRPGILPSTPLPGWSMTKSVLSALVGTLVLEGKLSLSQKELVPEWRSPDPRASITLSDMLRMSSGLRSTEVYSDPRSDVVRMLFTERDAAAYAARLPLVAPPGTVWKYSSATSNIISRVARETVGDEAYWALPRRALFEPLGMSTAFLEPDAAGTFVCSSFGFASARDWARFGQLFLQDGLWKGRRLLPEGWTAFCASPTPGSEGRYGAHWWLKLSKDIGGESPAAARIPEGAFHAVGHEGQVVTVIPSRGLVLVRLGLSIDIQAWPHADFVAGVLDALA